MQFKDSTAKWFNKLVNHHKVGSYPAMQALTHNVSLYPTARNLESVRNMAALLKPAKLRRDILATIDGVTAHEFKSEFRYTYHDYPKIGGRESACGSLFTQLHKALTPAT